MNQNSQQMASGQGNANSGNGSSPSSQKQPPAPQQQNSSSSQQSNNNQQPVPSGQQQSPNEMFMHMLMQNMPQSQNGMPPPQLPNMMMPQQMQMQAPPQFNQGYNQQHMGFQNQMMMGGQQNNGQMGGMPGQQQQHHNMGGQNNQHGSGHNNQGGNHFNNSKAKQEVNLNYKTERCRHYEQHGHCLLGERCHFAHGDAELRKPEDPIRPEHMQFARKDVQYQNCNQNNAGNSNNYNNGQGGRYGHQTKTRRGGMQNQTRGAPQQNRPNGGTFRGRGNAAAGHHNGHQQFRQANGVQQQNRNVGGMGPNGTPNGAGVHPQQNRQMRPKTNQNGSPNFQQQKPGNGGMATPAVEANYKTVPCRHFEQHGHCRYGEKCSYAHGAHELRANANAGGRGSKRNHHNNVNQQNQGGMQNMGQQMAPQPVQMGGKLGDMGNMGGAPSQFNGNNVGGQMMMQPGSMGAFGGQSVFMDPSALGMQMMLQQQQPQQPMENNQHQQQQQFYQQNMMQNQFMQMQQMAGLAAMGMQAQQNSMQGQPSDGGASRAQPKGLAWRFQSVEKNADGSSYNAANQLQIQQFDDSGATQARVQEVQKLLQHLPTPQQVEQAKQKLDLLRAENKIWYNVVKLDGSQPQDDDGSGAPQPAAVQGAGVTPGSGKQ